MASNLHIFGGNDGGADRLVLSLADVLLLQATDKAGDGCTDLPGDGRALHLVVSFLR